MRLQSNFLETLRDYEMEPPKYLPECIFESTIHGNTFLSEKLKEAEIIPPAYLLTSIEKEVGLINTPAKAKLFWIGDISMVKRISAAAAILALITTSILLTSPDQKKRRSIIFQQENKALHRISKTVIDSSKILKPARTKIVSVRKATIPPNPVRKSEIKASMLVYMPSEGDLWIKLVSFQTNQGAVENWINSTGEKRITIDEYSTLHVSDRVVNMMKALRETKANGKPTRKAIKTKKRMEKWKQKDEQYFSKDKSPLDPIDLGKLIFNN